MSFKIFKLQLTGKIKPVEKIEQHRSLLINDYQEFQEVEKSDELSLFLELEKRVNSEQFKKEKGEIAALHFKGSKEFHLLEEFEKLKKARHIKKYFAAADSAEQNRFERIKASEKLKGYDSLLDYMEKGQFQKEKKEIESQVFSGSVEEKHWTEFNRLKKLPGIKAFTELAKSDVLKKHKDFGATEKLKKFLELKNSPELDKVKKKEFSAIKRDSEIRSWFRFEKSKKLRLYRETAGSHDLKRYNELKSYVEGKEFTERQAFLKDRKKFEKSESYRKQQEFKKLAADEDIRFYLKYEKSAIHKNYLDVKDSFDLKRYRELQELATSNEFLERKAYLEDKQKWEKTEAFAQEQKYLEMKKNPRLIKYFKYKNTSDFDFLKNWEVVFEDDFSAPVLNAGKWTTSSYWADKLLGGNYSLPGDLHWFTPGKNCKTGGKLSIEVKKEKAEGKIWKMPGGFVPAEFDYTSGLVSTGRSFWNEDGIFEAKIKFSPEKEVVSSVYLQGEKNMPVVHLLEMGTKNRIGISNQDGNGKLIMEGLDISNLSKDKFYIFSVERSGKTFTWRINETEVLKLERTDTERSLHINASTLVVYEIPGLILPKARPVKFEIDWIKCYRKR